MFIHKQWNGHREPWDGRLFLRITKDEGGSQFRNSESDGISDGNTSRASSQLLSDSKSHILIWSINSILFLPLLPRTILATTRVIMTTTISTTGIKSCPWVKQTTKSSTKAIDDRIKYSMDFWKVFTDGNEDKQTCR